MALWILRVFFFLVSLGVGLSLMSAMEDTAYAWVSVPAMAAGAIIIVVMDVLVARKRIDMISSLYIGIMVGLFLTYMIGLALTPLFGQSDSNPEQMRSVVMLIIGCAMCYTCVSLLWQTKDDFRFIIPYVEFTKEVKGLKPYVLDTSVVIDGRIADVIETGILDNQLIMPRFVLAELQRIADSSDRMRRARGRRGLDVLNRLRSNPKVDLKIYDREIPEMAGQPVDTQLLILAKHLEGKIVTGDYNLNKVAKLHSVPVINLNDIANSLKPVFLPGEQINVQVVRAGEEAGQGVGYLEDGTMIVIEDGRELIGKKADIVVTSMLQTSAGRMVFGRSDRAKASKKAEAG